ncbi:MAG: RHS repeat-associated core domain-containing protein, partial [Bacteroidota bacterium]
GYVYVYVSNHTPGSKVYFDDLLVTLEEDIVTQATDYYAGGSVARRLNTPNSYFEGPGHDEKKNFGQYYRAGYQGKFAEEDSETGWASFELRNYDPTILRWTTMDPYQQYWSPYKAMGNNWPNSIDPDGGCVDSNGNSVPCPNGIPEKGNEHTMILDDQVEVFSDFESHIKPDATNFVLRDLNKSSFPSVGVLLHTVSGPLDDDIGSNRKVHKTIVIDQKDIEELNLALNNTSGNKTRKYEPKNTPPGKETILQRSVKNAASAMNKKDETLEPDTVWTGETEIFFERWDKKGVPRREAVVNGDTLWVAEPDQK